MITAVRLINCQSFEDVYFPLASDKVNILVAENNTGKSIFFKMLKVAASPIYYSREELKDLIRTGAEYAMAIYEFASGAVGAVVVTKKNVIYKFKNIGDLDFIAYTEPPQEFLDELDLVTNKNNFVANIIDTDQDMLLVDSDQKANGELLKVIAESSILSELEQKCTELISEFKSYGSDLSITSSGLGSQLSQLEFTDVDKLKREIKIQSVCIKACNNLIEIFNRTNSLLSATKDNKDYDKLLESLNFMNDLNEISIQCTKIKEYKEVDDSNIKLIDSLIRLSSVLNNLKVEKSFDDSCFDPLVKLNKISENLSKIKIVEDKSNLLPIIDCCLLMKEIISNLNSIKKSYEKNLSLSTELVNLQKEMKTLGKEVDCPIHGKVVYNGQKCLPYS